MSDVLAQFAAMIEQSSGPGGGSIELLVAQLGAEGELIRRCAITHQFTPETLRVLDPSLDEEEATARFHRLARLSLIVRSPDGLALHDRAREQLFSGWFAPERIGELREISRRLVDHIGALADAAVGAEREKLARRRIFHLVAVAQDAGINAFGEEFDTSRENLRFAACDNILRMIHEYDPILTPANRGRVNYREAKLALDRGNVDRALELFTSVVQEPAADLVHIAKALNGIGVAHAEECRWKRAALAFLDALRFAEEHEQTHSLRCGFLLNLAAVYRDTGYIDAAEALLQRSATMLASSTTPNHIAASVQNTFGTLYLRAAEPEKAIAALQESLEALNPDDFARARVYNNLGLASMRVPDLAAAEQWFNRSLEVKALAGDTVGQANTQINLVRLYREQQWPDKAVAAAAMAADLYARAFFWQEAGDANALLARFYLDAHKPAEAARALVAAFDAYERAHLPEEAERLRAQLVKPVPKSSFITHLTTPIDVESRVTELAEQLERQNDPKYAYGKRRGLALLLSMFVTGLGQFYNGDVKKGLAIILFTLIGGVARVMGESPGGDIGALRTIGVLVGIATYIWSTSDAWRVAAGTARRW
jgi:tetratricopeptide (TPR) repeat protein